MSFISLWFYHPSLHLKEDVISSSNEINHRRAGSIRPLILFTNILCFPENLVVHIAAEIRGLALLHLLNPTVAAIINAVPEF
jgi:hypothetical protein